MIDLTKLGADVRLLRHRRGWSQVKLAQMAGVPRWVVSRIESGRGDLVRPGRIAAVVVALGGHLSIRVTYRGEGLDRLRDRRHAAILDAMVQLLQALGWLVATEVSFNVYGDRGSIDILAFHQSTGALLVVEVKSVVPDLGGMFMTLDKKVRLAASIAAKRGWNASSVSRLLVLPDDRTARRRVAEHAATFEAAVPMRNVAVRRWLRDPSGDPLAGLLFLTDAQHVNKRRDRRP